MLNRTLQDSIQYIKGVGPKRGLLLKKLNINTVEDCLYFLPHRYEDRSKVKKMNQLVHGEQVTFVDKIINAGTFNIGRRKKIFEVILQDDTGIVRAKWFRFNEKYFREKFAVGSEAIVSGEPRYNSRVGAGLEIIHPDIEVVTGGAIDTLEIGRIIPVYHNTEGLHMKSIRQIMKQVIDVYVSLVEEILPDEILQRHKFPPRSEAFQFAHFPANGFTEEELQNFKTPAHQRLIFEELFLIQLGLAWRKKHATDTTKGTPLKTRGEMIRKLIQLLKFELTNAQKRVLSEIMGDLEKDRPMNRLIFGDVGSGKTIVAIITLMTAVDNGFQGALMAPTELLAEQHYLNIQPYCKALGISFELVTSAASPKEKKRIQESIQSGATQIIVGTHALIQKDVGFHNLGLAVIDEQQRFGVLQREAIGKKGIAPHILIMTATPIPRSLALTLYGDMDVSVLDELPPGRQPITTKIYYENKRDDAYEFLRKELDKGRQAYVVCPLIEESAMLDLNTAIAVQEHLTQLFPERIVGLVHGKLKKEDRQKIMTEFYAGKIDILVATTVIEVGIDVPNATVMIIEHSERFGLAQSHQLRGRVGRGANISYCILIAYYPLSDEAKARLKALLKSNDGFVIAEEDLSIRGPGDFMGTRQSGLPSLRIANLIRDIKVIEIARKEAFDLIDKDPRLEDPKHQKLKQTFQNFIGDKINLMNII